MIIDEQLLKDIRQYLQLKTGKYYFKHIKTLPNNLQVTCPFHKNGQEQKPSANIRTTQPDNNSTYIGNFHCFTCGISLSLKDVLKELLGSQYNEQEINEKFNLNTIEIENIFNEPEIIPFEIPKQQPNIKETTLRKYRTYNEYLSKRNINEDTAKLFDIGYDSITKEITFPIRDITRTVLGIGRRSVLDKRYNYPSNFVKPLYGVYELPRLYNSIFIVEGPFNLWSLTQWGKQGVALLGTGTHNQYKQLLNLKCKNYILTLDPDEAGRNGTNKIIKFLLENKKYNIYVSLMPDGKDVNDLTEEEFKNISVVTYKEWQRIYNFS